MLDWRIMSAPHRLGLFLAVGFLSFADSQLAYSQQPKPSDSQPSKPAGLILKRTQSNSGADSGPPKIEQLSDLVSRLLHYTGDAGCKKGDCKILVTNFILTTGYASPYGIQAADELALELARQDKAIQVIDRNLFKVQLQQLEEERIPIDILNSENVARWLGLKFGATIVLVGTARGLLNSNAVELSARFLNSLDVNKIGPSAEVNLAPSESLPDLSPIALPQLSPLPESFQGEQVYRAGVNGVGLPSCDYMPNPNYSDDARTFRFSGTILIEGIVRPDGTVRSFRFVRGAPYGLNQATVRALNTWRCKPATLEGKPVPVFVPFEVTLRLF
jgi:TonB family protein